MSLVQRQSVLIGTIATELGCEPKALAAVLQVEAAGEGLFDGRPIVRLEVNYLWNLALPANRNAVDQRFHASGPLPWQGHLWRPTPGGDWSPLHQPHDAGQRLEWQALNVARQIDDSAAIQATSWGAGQVMGFHWRDLGLGFGSPTEFADAQYDEAAQVRTFGAFLQRIAKLGPAIGRRDWFAVATAYNGVGQAKTYADDLAAAYARG